MIFDLKYHIFLARYCHHDENTLDSGIDVGHGINIEHGRFDKKNKPKPSLTIRTTSAIFWDYLGMFRDYGQKIIFFRNKTFLFFKIES
jgi:hypothetical protein